MARVQPAPGQLPLGAFAPTETPFDHLFFAVMPDLAAARRISALAKELRREHVPRGHALRLERFHVSLRSLGSVDRSRELPCGFVARASKAAADVSVPTFEVVFDRVCSFGRGRGSCPIVLRGGAGLVSLHALQQALEDRLRAEGFIVKSRSKFTPHLTLLYGGHDIAPRAVDPIAWTVRELMLIRSLVGRSEYRFLGRWPLRS